MMAAAQAAAEAALRETGSRQQGDNQSLNDPALVAGLLQDALQEDSIDEQYGAQHLLNEIVGYQRIMAQRDQKPVASPPEPQLPQGETKHYMTIAEDGTILEATKTVTGFPAKVLLMTSWFDSIYEDDLPGFVAVKTQFWDKNRPDVESFSRRRTSDGDWIWLCTKVVSYIDDPVQGVIVEERLVEDTDHAEQVNRITRIAAILMQAVQTAKRESERMEAARVALEAAKSESSNTNSDQTGSMGKDIPLVADDALQYQTWLEQAAGQSGGDLSGVADPLKAIMLAAAGGGTIEKAKREEADSNDPIAMLQKELMNGDGEERKGYDPLSALKDVRGEGTRLDLGMVSLSNSEIKLVSLVLTGRIKSENLGDFVYTALNTPGCSLTSQLEKYYTDSERQEHISQSTQPLHSGKHHRPKARSRVRHSVSRSRTDITPTMERSKHSRRPSTSRSDLIPPEPKERLFPASISVINLSYTYIGNKGMEIFGEFLYVEQNNLLETLDISFCGLDEKGILSFSRSLMKRKRRGINSLKGLIISGNYISYRAAKDLGLALAPGTDSYKSRKRTKVFNKGQEGHGYDEDSESDSDDIDADDDDPDDFVGSSRKRYSKKMGPCCSQDVGLQVLHFASSSLTTEALHQLLIGLGPHCPVKELCLASNNIGTSGISTLVDFLESKPKASSHPAMQFLERLDLSNNQLGNEGTTRLTKAIKKRVKNHFVDLRLSSNGIGHEGIETMMNKLLQHSILSLSLDKNAIGDQGCQLVAASLPSMQTLSRLNLSFNQIGSLGVCTLFKALVGCESITYLGLSGNIMKISGAIAMGFTLAQHPRLEELDLDNCCLSQAAQCHIVAGIMSNRWVPMKLLNGFQAGPPMAAIGAIGVYGHNLSNEECFRTKRDEQMKTILQWMESNRAARQGAQSVVGPGGLHPHHEQQQYLTPDFVSTMNEVHGTPSQNAYLRMLGWLSKIPFDEDELTTLRDYFYNADGGDGDRGSDGYINLKLRGDLLAALDSGVADEIRDQLPSFAGSDKGSVGLNVDKLLDSSQTTKWQFMSGKFVDNMPFSDVESFDRGSPLSVESDDGNAMARESTIDYGDPGESSNAPDDIYTSGQSHSEQQESALTLSRGSMSRLSMERSESERSNKSNASSTTERTRSRMKARITMFPPFESKLEQLKATAADMMDNEPDPEQQDIILTQYAEASLTILRQLRYHCMNSGLDGWRQGGLRRKVLIVDDSLVTRKLVARAFQKANFIVDTAENGVEGVKKMKASIYDIAFMDIDMPVMNGFEATKAFRQWEDIIRPGARQPICALTAAYVDDFERSELMKFKEAGLDVMESKPCNIPRLFKVVDDVSPMFSDLSISVSQTR
eukprot:CAMPEP_0178937206 /NCGR_PEP_ID=MMETSP0786-20121207/25619_1 /TAXON_ID=186022 /ORGANISM="Thalassionema frauenfeldii, Strain CCMP 1798" /LENGTH=1357 /DNA_ID=CAMNT_0020615733 /DNA_START=46 /DNA_END=4119 /DNA_ORIENTATION=+